MAKKRHLHKRGRTPAPRFLTRPRELYGTLRHVDEDETIKRIAAMTALCDEPESIGPAIISYAETNKIYDTLRHAKAVEAAREARKEITTEQRVAIAKARAKEQRCDVSHALHIIERGIERAKKGGRQVPASVIQRLEGVELLLDKPPELKAA
jgi:hypothetical protein